jgi:hypothetical protein
MSTAWRGLPVCLGHIDYDILMPIGHRQPKVQIYKGLLDRNSACRPGGIERFFRLETSAVLLGSLDIPVIQAQTLKLRYHHCGREQEALGNPDREPSRDHKSCTLPIWEEKAAPCDRASKARAWNERCSLASGASLHTGQRTCTTRQTRLTTLLPPHLLANFPRNCGGLNIHQRP